jgi:hypothetical protein
VLLSFVLFKGAGFLSRYSLFPPANFDPFFLRARIIAGRKPAPFTKTVKSAAPQFWKWTSLPI